MTPSFAERRARAALPLIQFMQTRMPLPLANRLIKQSAAHVRLQPGVKRAAVSADGVPAEWLLPQNCSAEQVLLYFHGGGFVFGLSPQHIPMVASLAQKLNRRALLVDYRVAPEAPFPAALEDCVKSYQWLLKQGFAAQNIVLAGDSAGGNLVITALMQLRDSKTPLPAAAACLSPVTDLTGNRERDPEIKDPLLSAKIMQFYNKAYLAGSDPANPLISPVYGDLRGLPPLLVHAGENEILREDAVRLTRLAEAAGVEVRLEIYPRMWHVWQLSLSLPQAIQSLDDIAGFLGAHLDSGK